MNPHPYLDQGLTIFQTRLNPRESAFSPAAENTARPFVTLSRETCAGATTLGQHLLALLNGAKGADGRSWLFLDNNLLTHALTTRDLPEHLARYLPEDRISEIEGTIGEILGLHPSLWELERRVAEAILQIARLGCVILAGRGAHLITRDLPGGFHVRLVASRAIRLQRLQELQPGERAAAARLLQEKDDARRRYVRASFGQELDDPHAYDLIINTDHILPATAAQLVLRGLQERVTSPVVPASHGAN